MAPEKGAAVKVKTIGHGENLRTSERTVNQKDSKDFGLNQKLVLVFSDFLRFSPWLTVYSLSVFWSSYEISGCHRA
ncbi:hypothetical protein GMPD_37400 [Geomonas paludis]|uniref:Uncharacterized protein n=1 Tax=Geomonas paludis TaxID=2740185 RepID=A0A6V8N088_9BACT|nr:hypothetical protein GMPD_37400 [Geomonas paludis]